MTIRRLSRPFRRGPRYIVASGEVLGQLRVHSERALPKETGGILLGYRTDESLVVAEAAEIPDPESSGVSYRRNQGIAQRLLDERREKEPGTLLGYVGEWHSHRCDEDASSVDFGTICEGTLEVGDSLGLIVVRRVGGGWEETAYATSRPRLRWTRAARFLGVSRVPVVTASELRVGNEDSGANEL